jgi:hypothetical protein
MPFEREILWHFQMLLLFVELPVGLETSRGAKQVSSIRLYALLLRPLACVCED